MKGNIHYLGRNVLRILAVVVMAIMLIGCENNQDLEISFVKTSYEIVVGDEVEVLVRLKNVSTDDLVYESGDAEIVTFDNGILKGVNVGKTMISIMVKDKLETRTEVYVEVVESVRKEFSITYFLNGGTNAKENKTTYSTDELPLTIHPATREHYIFKGWYVNATFVSEPVTVINVGTNSDVRLYALWEPLTYTLNYQTPEGTTNTNRTSFNILDLPFEFQPASLANHVFKGWFLDNSYTEEVTEMTVDLVNNSTIYAKFEKTYQITYHLNEGTLADPITIFSVSDLETTLPEPTKDGYIFDGWYDNPNFTGEKITKIMKEEDLVLFAKWSGGDKEYEITYNLNGGILPEDVVSIYSDQKTFILPIPTRDDARFLGWYLDDSFDTFKITEITAGSGGPITIYACWEFDITFIIDDEPTIVTVNYGNKLVEPAEPVKDGYNFVGWIIIEDDEEKSFDFNTAITTKIELIAKFSEQIA